jgi:hypothetical protein
MVCGCQWVRSLAHSRALRRCVERSRRHSRSDPCRREYCAERVYALSQVLRNRSRRLHHTMTGFARASRVVLSHSPVDLHGRRPRRGGGAGPHARRCACGDAIGRVCGFGCDVSRLFRVACVPFLFPCRSLRAPCRTSCQEFCLRRT